MLGVQVVRPAEAARGCVRKAPARGTCSRHLLVSPTGRPGAGGAGHCHLRGGPCGPVGLRLSELSLLPSEQPERGAGGGARWGLLPRSHGAAVGSEAGRAAGRQGSGCQKGGPGRHRQQETSDLNLNVSQALPLNREVVASRLWSELCPCLARSPL